MLKKIYIQSIIIYIFYISFLVIWYFLNVYKSINFPVFVDVDPKTFQIDTTKIEAKITSRTKAIIPVHILGIPADMTKIMAIAKKHNLIVIEDACQAHLAEVGGKRVGSIGHAGCFSFQTSKNMPIGEGGAITSDNEKFMDMCFSYHNLGNPYGTQVGSVSSGPFMIATKTRFSEYQAAIGLAQLKNLEKETDVRWENGKYLAGKIKGLRGISPTTLYPDTTKAAFHLFPMIYDKKQFKGMSRGLFLRSLNAEGVPCSSGYTPLHKQPFIKNALESRLFRKIYSDGDLNYESYMSNNQCPVNDRICNEESIWLSQNMLLRDKASMDNIANAIEKIYNNADEIVKKFQK